MATWRENSIMIVPVDLSISSKYCASGFFEVSGVPFTAVMMSFFSNPCFSAIYPGRTSAITSLPFLTVSLIPIFGRPFALSLY